MSDLSDLKKFTPFFQHAIGAKQFEKQVAESFDAEHGTFTLEEALLVLAREAGIPYAEISDVVGLRDGELEFATASLAQHGYINVDESGVNLTDKARAQIPNLKQIRYSGAN